LRFSELRKRLPDVSEKMLIQELKVLIDSDLVGRINHGTVPPKVEYYLTPKGRLVLPLIAEMRNFAVNYESIQ
jgi:DNA-binding HxlR family transcriptional regulator